jgi:hypothetical protein
MCTLSASLPGADAVLGSCRAAVGGVLLVAGGPGLFRQAQDPIQRDRIWTGMFYGLLIGVFIAGYTMLDGYAGKVLLLSPILLGYFGIFVRIAFLLPTVLRDRAAAALL